MRVSRLNQIAPEELTRVVCNAISLKEILDYLNLSWCENYHRLRMKLDELGIDFSHIKQGPRRPTIVGKSPAYNYRDFNIHEFLTENSVLTRSSLKHHLLKLSLLENKCAICGQLPFWNGKPLVLQIDHINGIFNDNRLENLRILCGHCHSQTPTFAGKAIRLQNNPINQCNYCDGCVTNGNTRCAACYSFQNRDVPPVIAFKIGRLCDLLRKNYQNLFGLSQLHPWPNT